MQIGDMWHFGPRAGGAECLPTIVIRPYTTSSDAWLIVAFDDIDLEITSRSKKHMHEVDGQWHPAKECPNGPYVAV